MGIIIIIVSVVVILAAVSYWVSTSKDKKVGGGFNTVRTVASGCLALGLLFIGVCFLLVGMCFAYFEYFGYAAS
jgi:hypothetical protein